MAPTIRANAVLNVSGHDNPVLSVDLPRSMTPNIATSDAAEKWTSRESGLPAENEQNSLFTFFSIGVER
jgi:hypothetical protein